MSISVFLGESLANAIKKTPRFIWKAVPRLVISGPLYFVALLFLTTLAVFAWNFALEFFFRSHPIFQLHPSPTPLFSRVLLSEGAITIAAVLTFAILSPFIIKIALAVHDGVNVPFHMPLSFNIWFSIMIYLAAFVSHLVLIPFFFPGIYFHLRFIFSYYAIIDQKKGAFGGLTQSWRITRPANRFVLYLSIFITLVWWLSTYLLTKNFTIFWTYFWTYSYLTMFVIPFEVVGTITYIIQQYPWHAVAGAAALFVLSSILLLFMVSLYRRLSALRTMEYHS